MMMGMMLMTGVRIISIMIFRLFHDVDHDSFPCFFLTRTRRYSRSLAGFRKLSGVVQTPLENGYSYPIDTYILS